VLRPDVDLTIFSVLLEDETCLNEAVDRFKPDVVILGEYNALANKTTLTHLFVKYPLIKLITVSEDNNWLHIYQREDLLLHKASELATVIRNI
jgi:hypothetical protein